MNNYKTPIYLYEPIKKNNVNIRMCLIVLPEGHIFDVLEQTSHFNGAIVKQLFDYLKDFRSQKINSSNCQISYRFFGFFSNFTNFIICWYIRV